MKELIPQEHLTEYATYDRTAKKFLWNFNVCGTGSTAIWRPTYQGAEAVLERWRTLLPDDHILTIIKKDVTNLYTDTMPD